MTTRSLKCARLDLFPLLIWFVCGSDVQNDVLCTQELQSGVVDLLIHTPNSTADVGSNTDRYVVETEIKTEF